ncbi:MAG: GNAT family N-acetyltransferase [Nitrospiraceae bacterium]
MSSVIRIRVVEWAIAEKNVCAIRKAVFVEQEGAPEELDLDGLDQDCLNMLARNDQGQPIGTARMQENDKIGRIAVPKPWRGRGVGRALLREFLTEAQRRGLSGDVSSGTNPGDRLLRATWLSDYRRRLPGRRHSPPELDSEVAHSAPGLTSLNVFDL